VRVGAGGGYLVPDLLDPRPQPVVGHGPVFGLEQSKELLRFIGVDTFRAQSIPQNHWRILTQIAGGNRGEPAEHSFVFDLIVIQRP
jgi:hypothetical protein